MDSRMDCCKVGSIQKSNYNEFQRGRRTIPIDSESWREKVKERKKAREDIHKSNSYKFDQVADKTKKKAELERVKNE